MGNFMGSYHWRTLGDLSTRIFTAANQAAMIALGNAAIPTRSHPGDIAVRTDLDNQWFIMTVRNEPSVVGDWTAITPWEAALIAINAIAQFPGVTTIQGVLDDCVSGDTAAAGNPFNIQTDATHDIVGGPTAALGNALPASGSVIAGAAGYVLADAGIALVTYLVPVQGDVIAINNLVSDQGFAQAGAVTAVAHAAVGGDITAANYVIGQQGLFAGDTAGDHVITRVIPFTLVTAANGALGAGVTLQAANASAGTAATDGVIMCADTNRAAAQAVGCAHGTITLLANTFDIVLLNLTGAPAVYPACNIDILAVRHIVIA